MKTGDGDSKSISNNGKDKNMGRWTKEEKQKFIDGKSINFLVKNIL